MRPFTPDDGHLPKGRAKRRTSRLKAYCFYRLNHAEKARDRCWKRYRRTQFKPRDQSVSVR